MKWRNIRKLFWIFIIYSVFLCKTIERTVSISIMKFIYFRKSLISVFGAQLHKIFKLNSFRKCLRRWYHGAFFYLFFALKVIAEILNHGCKSWRNNTVLLIFFIYIIETLKCSFWREFPLFICNSQFIFTTQILNTPQIRFQAINFLFWTNSFSLRILYFRQTTKTFQATLFHPLSSPEVSHEFRKCLIYIITEYTFLKLWEIQCIVSICIN